MLWKVGLQRTMTLRSKWPRPEQFFDTYYRDFISDPLKVVRQIYDHFGMTLTEEAERRMRLFMENNEKEKHGKHIYTAEQFGLEADAIAEEFAEYIDCFDLRK